MFFAAHITKDEVAQIRFGAEGQRWALMPVQDFLNHPQAIPGLKARIPHALTALAIPR